MLRIAGTSTLHQVQITFSTQIAGHHFFRFPQPPAYFGGYFRLDERLMENLLLHRTEHPGTVIGNERNVKPEIASDGGGVILGATGHEGHRQSALMQRANDFPESRSDRFGALRTEYRPVEIEGYEVKVFSFGILDHKMRAAYEEPPASPV